MQIGATNVSLCTCSDRFVYLKLHYERICLLFCKHLSWKHLELIGGNLKLAVYCILASR